MERERERELERVRVTRGALEVVVGEVLRERGELGRVERLELELEREARALVLRVWLRGAPLEPRAWRCGLEPGARVVALDGAGLQA